MIDTSDMVRLNVPYHVSLWSLIAAHIAAHYSKAIFVNSVCKVDHGINLYVNLFSTSPK